MTIAAALKPLGKIIARSDPLQPILIVAGSASLSIRAGTVIRLGERDHAFDADTPVALGNLVPGTDYAIALDTAGTPLYSPASTNPLDGGAIAGFHFAPGGNASARSGGDSNPAINPHSLWDINFRFDGPDPRGMVLVEMGDKRFWVDIYLLGTDHARQGTSRFGATVADGRSMSRLNYQDAVEIYAGHGKSLLTYDQFRAAAFGVTEKSSAERHPKSTGLDAARTSRYGLMQATGNLWVWGTDGDPEDPRPSLFGGSWFVGDDAGSRCAYLGCWPGDSYGDLSARGGGDHLQPA